MLKIMLLLPPARAHYIVPPVGLGYLATSLKRYGLDRVSIVDGQKEELTRRTLVRHLLDTRPDVVGVQVFSSGFSTARRAMQIVHETLPRCVIIAGGPHVTATPDRVLADLPEAAYALWGEAEPGLPQLVSHIAGGKPGNIASIPGLIFRDGERAIINERAIVENLDGLGFPAWECMPPDTYPDSPQGVFYKRFPIAPLLTTRGCPYECTYCGSPVNMTRNYRVRSIRHVLDEVELLYYRYGVREIHIIDDMFSLRRERVLEFCDGLERRKLNISYTFPNGLRLDSLDREILIRMKETGAYAFTVGIESGSERTLSAMKKKLTTAVIRDQVKLICDCGLEPSGFFIIGFPGETRADIEKTIRFAKSLPIKRAHFSNYLPLPGTESTEALYRRGELRPGVWDRLAYYETPYAPVGMTTSELKRLQRRAYLGFHLRPRILLKMLSEIRSFNHFKGIVIRASDYLRTSHSRGDEYLR